MSEKKPISIYLSPSSSLILSQYVEASGYGSVSRTVEEIILAFDDIHATVIMYNQSIKEQGEDDPKILPAIQSYATKASMRKIRHTLTRLKRSWGRENQ